MIIKKFSKKKYTIHLLYIKSVNILYISIYLKSGIIAYIILFGNSVLFTIPIIAILVLIGKTTVL